MAEAVGEERPQPPQRFYCHLCNVEVQTVNADFTCPLCSGGFIEELPASTLAEQSSEDVEMQDVNGLDDLDLIRDEIATLLMAGEGGRPPEQDLDDDTTHSISANLPGTNISAWIGGNPSDSNPSTSNGRIGIGGMIRRSRRRPRVQNFERFDNVIFEILQTLSGGNEGSLGNASMFFMGNPGDYAWGREGIDTIVTQLLNQMDTTGPPPLPKEKIEEIPNVEITQEQVDQKLQCSVCWEDFKAMECVRKLPCLHVYHENCIVPWLELHGTCPICRKSLTPEGSEGPSSLRNASVYSRSSSDVELGGGNMNSGVIGGRLTSAALSSGTGTGSNSTQTTSVSGQQTRPLPPIPAATNIFTSIPSSFTRVFSLGGTPMSSATPTTSQQMLPPPAHAIALRSAPTVQPAAIVAAVPGPAVASCSSSATPSAQLQSSSSNSESGSATRLEGSSDSRNSSSSQTDVYKFDDGNVEYEFD